MKFDPTRYFPINNIKILRETIFLNLTDAEVKRWRIYRSSLTKTPFMINLLHDLQMGLCPICNKFMMLNKSVIHHIDYECLCYSFEFLRIMKPTPKKPCRTIRIAKCEYCPDTTSCIEKIKLVHKRCHMYLHVKDGRIINKRSKINGDNQLLLFAMDALY